MEETMKNIVRAVKDSGGELSFGMEKVSLENVEGELVARENTKDQAEVEKNKKKKKKKKPKSNLTRLPSQELLEKNFPVRITSLPNKSRCAVATRPLKVGDVVMTERAVSFVVREKFIFSNCHGCCRRLDPSGSDMGGNCNSCNHALYCKDCGPAFSEMHRNMCFVLRKLPAMAKRADCDLTLLRLILELSVLDQAKKQLVESKGSPSKEAELSGQVQSMFGAEKASNLGAQKGIFLLSDITDVKALESHASTMDPCWVDSITKGCRELREVVLRGSPAAMAENLGKDSTFPSVEEIVQFAAIVHTNSYGMGAHQGSAHEEDKGLGLFPFVTLLNHSCRPNCIFYSSEDIMYVRATQDIRQGAKLTLSYINLYKPRFVRQLELRKSKHFDCFCERCSEPLETSVDRLLEGVLCNAKGCPGVLIERPTGQSEASDPLVPNQMWQCDLCRRIVSPMTSALRSAVSGEVGGGRGKPQSLMDGSDRPWETVARASLEVGKGLQLYRERRLKEARAILEKLLEDYKMVLHPRHVYFFDALTPLMNVCREEGDALRALLHCEAALQALQEVTPGQILEHAGFLYSMGELQEMRAASVGQSSSKLSRRLREKAQECFKKAQHIEQLCFGAIGE